MTQESILGRSQPRQGASGAQQDTQDLDGKIAPVARPSAAGDGATEARRRRHAALRWEGPVIPFTRVLASEQTDRANRYRAYKLALGLAFGQQWGTRSPLGSAACPLRVDILIALAPRQLWVLDLDNVIKGLLDAAQPRVIADDRYVEEIIGRKTPANPDLPAGAYLRLTWPADGYPPARPAAGTGETP